MPDGSSPVTFKAIDSINAVDAAEWDACSGTDNPFVSHAFLKACEDSGSAVPQQGWGAQHLIVADESGKVVACAPLYLKSHSYGEYVFDWGWAEAYQRAGGRYYPKLLSAVPFTPATGPRLLIRPGAPESLFEVLTGAMVHIAERSNLSSVHINFPTQAQWQRCADAGFMLRIGKQFHWENKGYGTFDDFLDALASRKRKALRKERREVAQSGVVLHALTGSDIKERHWDAFFDFYMDTADRKWGQPYLTRKFFSLLGEWMADKVLLVLAEKDGRPVGGALNLIGSEAVFGRYWGCLEAFRFLHFEACYYMAIDFAIERGLRWVEAGAGGRHKLQRGYLARPTYSAHWVANESFRRAVEQFLSEERFAVEREIAAYDAQSPFRQEGP